MLSRSWVPGRAADPGCCFVRKKLNIGRHILRLHGNTTDQPYGEGMTRSRSSRRPSGGPDEGRYDPRRGAAGYAPIVASFGALAVTAIVVVFTIPPGLTTPDNVTLTTGLLAMVVFASFLGSFGLAAVGAEDDPTANLPATVMFMAIPVAVAFVGVLGAFEALAATFVPESTTLFALITCAGGATAVMFSAYVVGDSWSMHPTTMRDPAIFQAWRKQQWIQNQKHANDQSNLIVLGGMVPLIISVILRFAKAHLDVGLAGINIVVGAGIVSSMLATGYALNRARHPDQGNDQIGIKQWEAWTSTLTISFYTSGLVLILPI